MKIVVIEARKDHYETLGYFFFLKKRMRNIEIIFYARDPKNTWLDFFKKNIADAEVRDLNLLMKSENERLGGDIAFLNSIDASWDGVGDEIIDSHANFLINNSGTKRIFFQLHMGSNKNAEKFKNTIANHVSPFPNQGCTRLLMTYDLGKPSKKILNSGKKLKITIVGGIHKFRKETVEALAKKFELVHFSPTDGQRINNVNYYIKTPAEFLVNHLIENTDYILLDYPFNDRLSGIVLHALSLEIPMLINKTYSEVLDIPKNTYIEYSNPEDLINFDRLNDNQNYTTLKENIKAFKNALIRNCDSYFRLKRGKLVGFPIQKEYGCAQSNKLWQKEYFKGLWNSSLPLDTRFSLSNGLFLNRDAYIFAAGPSLRKIDIDSLRNRLKNSLVICIKQSIDIVGFDCDALIMNFCNFSGYNWDLIDCPTFWTTWNPSQPKLIKDKNAKCNVVFKVTDNGKPDEKTLPLTTAGSGNWINLLKLPDAIVPWGPGLMYEIAIPLALHAGVSHIHLVGWDIGSLNKKSTEAFSNEHFYDNSKIEMATKITNLEILTVANSTASLKNWLEIRGIGLSVISDQSLVHESVSRENKWIKK